MTQLPRLEVISADDRSYLDFHISTKPFRQSDRAAAEAQTYDCQSYFRSSLCTPQKIDGLGTRGID